MQDNDFLFPENIYSNHLASINGIKFTRREIDVIACLLSARGTSKIASLLSIALRTVVSHIRNIMLKLECGSREGIIDFIERSHKLPLLREYYASLITEVAFEKSLKEISKLKHDEPPKCLVIYWENQDLRNAFLQHLDHHLQKAGIKVEVQEHTHTQKIEALENLDHSLLLLVPKQSEKEIAQEFMDFGFIDLSEHKNYYLAAFEIFKSFIPSSSLDGIFLNFQEHSEGVKYVSRNEKIKRDGKEISRSNGIFFKVAPFLKEKWCLMISLSVLGLVSTGILVFKTRNEVNQSPSLTYSTNQETNQKAPIRSDLIIPRESSLLHRRELIAQIDNKLKSQHGIQTVALVGPGGAGKTILARQYVNQQRADVIWEINAETQESLRSSFESLAEALAKTEEDKKILRSLQEIKNPIEKEEKTIQFVKDRVRYYEKWFLIFDNAEKFIDMQKYLPQDPLTWGHGKVIITTRNSNIQNNTHIDNIIFIGELSPSQKSDLFTKITNHGNDHPLSSSQMSKIKSFLEHIPSFPLDISVSAYYLMSTGVSYESYLESIEASNKDFNEVQKSLLKEAGNYTKTRYGIITSSLQRFLNTNQEFRDLLLLISLIDSQNIPRDLLEKYKPKSVVDNFIYGLKKYSFIINERFSFPNPMATFSIHRSTQAVALAYLAKLLKADQISHIPSLIPTLLTDYMDGAVENEDIAKMKILINHGERFLSHEKLLGNATKGSLGCKLGNIYRALDNYEKAKKLCKQSYSIIKETYGEGHLQTASVLANLGNVYRKSGEYILAENILKEALAIYEKNNDKIRIAWVCGHLGSVYSYLGAFKKAVNFFKKSLSLYKQEKIESPLGFAWVAGHLGRAYIYTCEYEKAEKFLQQSLSIYNQYKKDHRIAWTLANLGNVYKATGNYTKAKDFLEKSLSLYSEHYDKNHINIGWVSDHLGVTYNYLGNHEKAKSLCEKSLVIFKKLFGDDHIQTAWAYFHLGKVYSCLGNYQSSRIFLTKILPLFEKHYGENRAETAEILHALGETYLGEGDIETAERFFINAVNIYSKEKHPEVYLVLESLAELYAKRMLMEANKGDIKLAQSFQLQAVSNLEQALQIVKTHFPKDSPHITRIEAKLRNFISVRF